MKRGGYEVIKTVEGFYFVKELDSRFRVYRIIEVLQLKDKYEITEVNVGIAKEDLIEDEKHIFPNGRSMSKFKNAISVYKYFGRDLTDSNFMCVYSKDKMVEMVDELILK